MARRRNIPQVVEAEQFVLRDSRGRARATLSLVGQHESPALQLLDTEGRPRVAVEVEAGGRAVVRLEAASGAMVGLSVDDAGTVGMSMSRPGGMIAFEVGCYADGEVRITVYDRGGCPVWPGPGAP